MKKNMSLVLGITLAALPSISVASMEDVTTYIINGVSASTSAYETFVSLYTDKRDVNGTYDGSPYCGGTILDSTHVLTAAHCIFDGSGSLDDNAKYIAVVQSDDVENLATTSVPVYSVTKLYYRDDYDDSSSSLWANDIAILELSSSMNTSATTTPVSSESSYQNTSEDFVAIGFGTTDNDSNDGSDSLLQTSLFYDDCGSDSRITAGHLCFDGDVPTGKTLKNATCSGDSGGPIYWNDGGDVRQVGIVSFGPNECGDPSDEYVTGTTELSNYSSWISAVQSGDLESGTYECSISGSSINCTRPSGAGSISVSDSSSSDPFASLPADSSEGGSVPLISSLLLLAAALFRKYFN